MKVALTVPPGPTATIGPLAQASPAKKLGLEIVGLAIELDHPKSFNNVGAAEQLGPALAWLSELEPTVCLTRPMDSLPDYSTGRTLAAGM